MNTNLNSRKHNKRRTIPSISGSDFIKVVHESDEAPSTFSMIRDKSIVLLQDFTGYDHGKLVVFFHKRDIKVQLARGGVGIAYPLEIGIRNIAGIYRLIIPSFRDPHLFINQDRFLLNEMGEYPEKFLTTLNAINKESVGITGSF